MLGSDPQSGIEACNRLMHAIELEQGVAPIAERTDMVGAKRQRTVKARKRFGDAIDAQPGDAQAIVRVRILRCDPACGLIAGNRVLGSPRCQEHQTQITLCICPARVERQGSTQELFGALEPPALIVEHGGEMERIEMPRVAAQDLGIELLRRVELARFMQAASTTESRREL